MPDAGLLRYVAAVGLLALGLGGPTPVLAQAERAQVEAAVRAYVAARNTADAGAVAALFSMQPGVTSIGDGEVQRGWDQIRRHLSVLDSLTAAHQRATLTVGSVDVTPLGSSFALAIAGYTLTTTGPGGAAQRRGAMTLVLQKVDKDWKIIHDHLSTVPAPRGTERPVAVAPAAGPTAGTVIRAPTASSTIVIVSSADLEVPAQGVAHYDFQIPDAVCTVTGRAEGLAGGNKDFEVLILDDDNYRNWNAGLQAKAYGSTGRVTVANINAVIPGPGTYHLVINNAFLPAVAKTVELSAQAKCP
jgi:uncharacterized protein (TIGR02246 family)